MDSGSSKGFDFASDDILCSYEDYTTQDNSNGTHSDSAIATKSSKEFHKNRMSRASFPSSSYSSPDDSGNQDVIIAAVERLMKKHFENLMRFLEGISSRLSQLELYCYNVDKCVGEMRSDLARDNGEADAKLKFLEKHIQEVHRSVQIIRDKQELADTQKELAKLQLAQKESSAHDSQKSDETSTPSSDTKRNDNTPDGHNQQLALALPHQVAPTATPQPQILPQPISQSQTYYLSPAQFPNIPAPNQITQNHYLQPDSHYQTPPPPRSQASQPQPQPQLQSQPQHQPQLHSHPQYQQQWAQQAPQQVQPPQPTVRPSSPQVFPQPYLPSQQVNPSTPETLPNSMSYAFGGPSRTNPQPPPQNLKLGYGGAPNDGYVSGGPQGNTFMYDGEGGSGSGRVQHPNHPSHFPQPVYPPNPQQSSGGSMIARPPPQFMRNHPYNELIDKLGSMGYRGEHVMSVIQWLEENGQTVDFNSVLDRLNAHPSGTASQRGW